MYIPMTFNLPEPSHHDRSLRAAEAYERERALREVDELARLRRKTARRERRQQRLAAHRGRDHTVTTRLLTRLRRA
jgi:hypothetical protein